MKRHRPRDRFCNHTGGSRKKHRVSLLYQKTGEQETEKELMPCDLAWARGRALAQRGAVVSWWIPGILGAAALCLAGVTHWMSAAGKYHDSACEGASVDRSRLVIFVWIDTLIPEGASPVTKMIAGLFD